MLFLELSWTTHSLDVYKQIIEVYEILFVGVCIICCPEAFLWHFSNICKISCMLNSFIQTIIEASPDWITWTEFWWLIAAKSVIYCWKNTIQDLCTTIQYLVLFKQHIILQCCSEFHFRCFQRMKFFEMSPNHTINMGILRTVVVSAI